MLFYYKKGIGLRVICKETDQNNCDYLNQQTGRERRHVFTQSFM